jgi:hypothetical protein
MKTAQPARDITSKYPPGPSAVPMDLPDQSRHLGPGPGACLINQLSRICRITSPAWRSSSESYTDCCVRYSPTPGPFSKHDTSGTIRWEEMTRLRQKRHRGREWRNLAWLEPLDTWWSWSNSHSDLVSRVSYIGATSDGLRKKIFCPWVQGTVVWEANMEDLAVRLHSDWIAPTILRELRRGDRDGSN